MTITELAADELAAELEAEAAAAKTPEDARRLRAMARLAGDVAWMRRRLAGALDAPQGREAPGAGTGSAADVPERYRGAWEALRAFVVRHPDGVPPGVAEAVGRIEHALETMEDLQRLARDLEQELIKWTHRCAAAEDVVHAVRAAARAGGHVSDGVKAALREWEQR